MPTATFFNLPPPKREKLVKAAIAEFTKKPYGEVSINRVIQAAEIPRGSFYQYFADKTDLFHYVLGQFGRGLETLLLDCFAACGGRPMEMPLVLFDRVVERSRSGQEEFRTAMAILRQNMGLDMSQFGGFSACRRNLAEQLDLSGLDLRSPEEAEVLLELLCECAAHALAFAISGELTAEESRNHLTCKLALIRRGVEAKEENPC